MAENMSVTVDSKYHRDQFDDWLAGGKVEYEDRRYYWSAQNNGCGFGWEIEPVSEDDWTDIPKDKSNEIIRLIEKCLYQHRTEYVF
jgi:hypothetical protein